LNNLEKIYNTKAAKSTKSRKEMAAEMDLFFGASQIFCQIFKLAILKTFDQKREHEEEMKKEKEKAK
jgi:hypothetical protein